MRSKRALYNILSNLALQAVTIMYGFIVPKIIIDYFGSDVNGLVSSITQFLAYITFLESGFGPVIRAALYKPIATKNRNAILGILKASEKIFRRIALAFIVYIVILCIFFPLIVKKDFDTTFTIPLIIVMGVSNFAEYYFGMIYRLFLQAEQKTYIVSVIQIVTYIMGVLLVVVLALAGCNIFIIKLVTGLVFVIRPLAQNFYVKKKYNISLKNVPRCYPISQKWDGLAQHIAAIIRDNTDVTVLTLFATLADVSVYSVYYLVVLGLRRIMLAISNSFDALFGDMIAKKEEENLKKKFSAYELVYMIITTVAYTCAFLMITPFVSLYTNGVTDADYYQPLFGYLLVLSGLVFAFMIPYSSLTLTAGHFKETRRGAWFEAIVNVILSIVLVFHFGLIGVAIGTVVAVLIRTIEFIYHVNKYILKRNNWSSMKKILLSIITTIIVSIVMQVFYNPVPDSYFGWIFDTFVVFAVATVASIAMYVVFCRKEVLTVAVQLKKILNHKRKKQGV